MAPGMLVIYIFYYKDLSPDFYNILGCFLLEIGSVLPCFFVQSHFCKVPSAVNNSKK